MLYSISDEEVIKNRITAMREDLSKTSYSCAFEYAMRNDESNLQKVLIEADEKMYADKKAIKEEIQKQGGEIHIRE